MSMLRTTSPERTLGSSRRRRIAWRALENQIYFFVFFVCGNFAFYHILCEGLPRVGLAALAQVREKFLLQVNPENKFSKIYNYTFFCGEMCAAAYFDWTSISLKSCFSLVETLTLGAASAETAAAATAAGSVTIGTPVDDKNVVVFTFL